MTAISDVGERTFKDSMARLAFAVAVATARSADGILGRTVTSFMPLSADPASLIVSIDAGSGLAAAILASGVFSMSFLASGHEAVGDAFAGKRPPADRFEAGAWDRWPSGNPRLVGATLALDCRVVGIVEAGEHVLFVGAVVGAQAAEGAPLIWSARGYRMLAPGSPDPGSIDRGAA